MARSPRRRGIVKRPSIFKDEKAAEQAVKNIAKNLVDEVLDTGMKAVHKEKPNNIEAKRMPNYLKLTERRMDKLGVIDLKPYFARSPKRKKPKFGKPGSWYLVVPISRKTRDMSRRMYDQLRSIDIGSAERATVRTDYLYDRRRQSDAKLLNYKPKSNTIEKRRAGKNRHVYTAYRTVSDKSPANSWIINRDKVNRDDTSKTFVRNVSRLMKWKMKNGWS